LAFVFILNAKTAGVPTASGLFNAYNGVFLCGMIKDFRCLYIPLATCDRTAWTYSFQDNTFSYLSLNYKGFICGFCPCRVPSRTASMKLAKTLKLLGHH
jgi:hypothetical protein